MYLTALQVNNFTPQLNSKKTAKKQNLNQTMFRDIFVRTNRYISFGHSDETEKTFQWIEDIKKGLANILGGGWNGIVYQVDGDTGLKVPEPKYPNHPNADINGYNNVKENFILNKIRKIDAEIAKEPVSLVEKDGKYYLATRLINGIHPMSSGLSEKHLIGIINKTFKLDINGIVNTDLQGTNIILEKENEKFIDFGSYNILNDNGYYIDSNGVDYRQFMDGGFIEKETGSEYKQKFLNTFLNNNPKMGIKNYSDNQHLKIISNISNFEFRALYPYLMAKGQKNPKELFKEYLKIKANTYHSQMELFLTSLNPTDDYVKNQLNEAIEQERVFKELYKNPSENVIKTELGKIQLKWLSNDFENSQNLLPGIRKVSGFFRTFIDNTNEYQKQASGVERKYFDGILSHFSDFLHLQNIQEALDLPLADSENILKRLHCL